MIREMNYSSMYEMDAQGMKTLSFKLITIFQRLLVERLRNNAFEAHNLEVLSQAEACPDSQIVKVARRPFFTSVRLPDILICTISSLLFLVLFKYNILNFIPHIIKQLSE